MKLLGDNLSYFTCLFHLIFSLYNKLIFRIFTYFFFTFVGNKINRANLAKRTKDGTRIAGRTRTKRRREGWPRPPTVATLQVAGRGAMTATYCAGNGWLSLPPAYSSSFLARARFLFTSLLRDFWGSSLAIFRVILG